MDIHNFCIMKYLCNLQKLYTIKKFFLLYICTFNNNNFVFLVITIRLSCPSYFPGGNWIPMMFQVETCHSCFCLFKTLLLNLND